MDKGWRRLQEKRQGTQGGDCGLQRQVGKAQRSGSGGRCGKGDEGLLPSRTGDFLDMCVGGDRAPKVEPGQL